MHTTYNIFEQREKEREREREVSLCLLLLPLLLSRVRSPPLKMSGSLGGGKKVRKHSAQKRFNSFTRVW